MAKVIIAGFTTNNKKPGYFAETQYGFGGTGVGGAARKCLVSGNKTSAGIGVVNTEYRVFSEADGTSYFGTGSEIARMCYVALLVQGVELYAMASAEAGGASAATAVLTVTGTWTAAGELGVYIDGLRFAVSVAANDTVTTLADRITDEVAQRPKLAVTGANVAGVHTMTTRNTGLRTLGHSLYVDSTLLPTGCVVTPTGGTAMTGGGVHFVGGAGTEDITTMLAAEFAGRYHNIGAAQADATNAALWEDQLNSKAGPLEGRTQHICFGSTAPLLSTATSLAQTTLNTQRAQLLWMLDGESHPSEIAAAKAALRSVTEQTDINASYDDAALLGIAPHRFNAALPSTATQISALDNGVTPITTSDGRARVVRSITTRSRDASSNPDYSTLDTSDAVVPDFIRDDLGIAWKAFQLANPRVHADPAPEDKPLASGVGYPALWNATVLARLHLHERNLILQDVDTNPPFSEYDDDADRIMSAVTVVAARNNHQIGVSVRQKAA